MAKTTYLKKNVEEFVREKLAKEFGVPFNSKTLELITGGTHEFDAVSEDEQVVGAIKTSSGKASSGRVPPGPIRACEAELYYLNLISAHRRMLILTSSFFYEKMEKYLKLGKRLAPGISLKLIELPIKMKEKVEEIQKKASDEVSGKKIML